MLEDSLKLDLSKKIPTGLFTNVSDASSWLFCLLLVCCNDLLLPVVLLATLLSLHSAPYSWQFVQGNWLAVHLSFD